MEIKTSDYEKLGVFYLGRAYDFEQKRAKDSLVLYDAKDLVTHGVILGMTGSGKTGLSLAILEEAAIDNIPALLIDPKGDLPNLLLNFPELRGSDFRPWINEEDAARRDQTPDAYAEAQAELWRKGLTQWGQDGSRLALLRDKVEMVVYTPGSQAGIPVSILSSLDAPPFEVVDDAELFADRIESTVSSLLSLLGINADPLQSREHILLSNIFNVRWRAGESLTLARLVHDIQTPPFGQVGVVDVETFLPEKKRVELAMSLNSLLAAPGFQTWLHGVPLDIKNILYTPEGKPRLAIFSIAHLDDTERMFFVSLLLNQVVGWMRAQSGTTSLRALLYMDEIFGYLPPTANPPSKKPLLTLLKQARAFGLGVLVATQNPVDLDYKALSNIGTWWLGRLQTERDKARVLDGLEGAASAHQSGFNRAEMDRLLSGLGNRIFLMHNTHEDHPEVMQVRWCLSYLRGPLTRTQIKTLMDPHRARLLAQAGGRTTAAEPPRPLASAPTAAASTPKTAAPAATRPALAKTITELFLPVRTANPQQWPIVAVPHLLRAAEILFSDPKKGLHGKKKVTLLDPLKASDQTFETRGALRLTHQGREVFSPEPEPHIAEWRPLPAFALQAKAYKAVETEFIEYCYLHEGMELLAAPELGLWSQPDETEGEFRARLALRAREQRDAAVAELRQKFAKKAQPIEERLRRAQATLQKKKEQRQGAWIQTAVSIGGSVLSVLLGRKSKTRSLSTGATAMRQVGRAWSQGGELDRAEETVEAVQKQLDALEEECAASLAALEDKFDAARMKLTQQILPPLKKNIAVTAVGVAWLPYFKVSDTALEPAWEA